MNESENTVAGQEASSSGLSNEFLASLSDFRENLQSAQEATLRYEQENNPLALDEAIAAWERLCSRPDFLTALSYFRALALSLGGHRYLDRYYSRREIRDLRLAIKLWQAAVELSPFDPPDPQLAIHCYLQLAAGFYQLYNRVNEPTDLEQALCCKTLLASKRSRVSYDPSSLPMISILPVLLVHSVLYIKRTSFNGRVLSSICSQTMPGGSLSLMICFPKRSCK